MPIDLSISDALLQTNIVRAVGEVFQTMLEEPVVLVDPTTFIAGTGLPPAAPLPQVVGSVGFAGKANGILYLCFGADCGVKYTGKILGMTAAEVGETGDELVNDAIGELTNMVAGSFKNALCDAGYPCLLTVPSLLRGLNFCVQPWPAHSVRRLTYHFQSREEKIVADLLMKTDDDSSASHLKNHAPENPHGRRLQNSSPLS